MVKEVTQTEQLSASFNLSLWNVNEQPRTRSRDRPRDRYANFSSNFSKITKGRKTVETASCRHWHVIHTWEKERSAEIGKGLTINLWFYILSSLIYSPIHACSFIQSSRPDVYVIETEMHVLACLLNGWERNERNVSNATWRNVT